MTLHDLILNSRPLTPWSQGEKIPWDDLKFSARMLKEHLSQSHNAASRRTQKIEQHVHWIHQFILKEQPANILDLCCGPGFYTHRLNQLGHTCTGIDFGPASIAYAQKQNKPSHLHPFRYSSDRIRFKPRLGHAHQRRIQSLSIKRHATNSHQSR